jgi:hypothetical protein
MLGPQTASLDDEVREVHAPRSAADFRGLLLLFLLRLGGFGVVGGFVLPASASGSSTRSRCPSGARLAHDLGGQLSCRFALEQFADVLCASTIRMPLRMAGM